MHAQTPSFIASRISSFGTAALVALGFLALPATAQATPVTSWTMTTPATSQNISGLNTASPVFGTGVAGSGNGFQINAAIPTYTLSVGDSLTFSGSANFSLNAGANSDQFRFGIFDTHGSTNTNGWLGYFATNSGSGGNPNGRLWERTNGNTTAYFNNTQTPTIAAEELQFRNGGAFVAGTYDFSLAVTRTETGLSIVWSLVGTGDTTYSLGGTHNDTTAQTFSFNRVGLMTGGNMNADQVTFSNLDVTYSAIPEPASAVAGLAIVAGFFTLTARRRRTSRAL